MIIKLVRSPATPDGVFGVFTVPDRGTLVSMEDDERGNLRGVSCIPVGTYRIRRYYSPKRRYEVFMLVDVPGREAIEIHIANTEEDVEGCIGLGTRYGTLQVHDEDAPGQPLVSKLAVLQSKWAFGLFMQWMEGINEAVLEVSWA